MVGERERLLKEVDALRSRVIHVVGHALRTPVCTIRGLSDLLHGADAERVRDVIPALRRGAAALERLVDDLLLASGVSATTPAGPLQPVDLAAAARSIWEAAGHDEELCVQGEVPAVALAHEGSAERILIHLLENASRYGEAPFVACLSAEGGFVALALSSGGPEPSERDLALAFEPFWRSERAVTLASGLGLGLTVARTLARHAGGDVTLQRRDGGGVTATVRLPASPADPGGTP